MWAPFWPKNTPSISAGDKICKKYSGSSVSGANLLNNENRWRTWSRRGSNKFHLMFAGPIQKYKNEKVGNTEMNKKDP